MDGKDKPSPPPEDIREKQDPDFTQEEFLEALRKVARKNSDEEITQQPSEPDQESPRKGAQRRRDD